MDDREKSFFGQDHWIITPKIALDLGVRTESQQISGAFRVAPRAGLVFMPLAELKTVIRAGYGLFYDRVPLNVYGFNRYPDRVVTAFNPDGTISSGPNVYLNTLGQNRVRFPFVNQKPVDGNFSPRSEIWSIQAEQPFGRYVKVRATFLKNDSDGLVKFTRIPPDPGTNIGAYLLEGTGASHYRQFDVVGTIKIREDRQIFASYTRSNAIGDLNEFGQFLGSVPTAVIRENQYGILPTNMPDRFLLWGVMRFPLQFQIAPVIEGRTGFPYSNLDAAQRYVGIPNGQTFPTFFSLDSRISKDFKVNPKYSVRASISTFNWTNHNNPEAVHANIADPAHGISSACGIGISRSISISFSEETRKADLLPAASVRVAGLLAHRQPPLHFNGARCGGKPSGTDSARARERRASARHASGSTGRATVRGRSK